MPIERRRSKNTNRTFASPFGEQVYWETERLLDEAPITGELELQPLFDAWYEIGRRARDNSSSEDEALQMSWGTMVFFVLERLTDLRLMNLNSTTISPMLTETQVLHLWNKLNNQHAIPGTQRFQGEPTVLVAGAMNDKNLHTRNPAEVLQVPIEYGPLYGHIQVIDCMEQLQPIPQQLIEALVKVSKSEGKDLKIELEFWNKYVSEPEDSTNYRTLLETSHDMIVSYLIIGWGKDPDFNAQLLARCYLEITGKPASRFPVRGPRQWDKDMEESGINFYGQAILLPFITKLISGKNLEPRAGEDIAYAVELKFFKDAYFAILVTLDKQANKFIGTLLVAKPNNNPPRKHHEPITLEADTPEAAIKEVIEFALQTKERPIPEGLKINFNAYAKGVKRLASQPIMKVGYRAK